MSYASRSVLLLPLLTLGLACGEPNTPSTPARSTVAPAPSAAAVATAGASETGGASTKRPGPPASAAPVATTGAPPPTAGGDYEITFGDCADLVANFERRLREEEMAKLEAQKLKGKSYEAGLETVNEVVRQGVENWRGQCHSIVGTVQVRSRIRCAVAAETRARFDGCWDGQFDGE